MSQWQVQACVQGLSEAFLPPMVIDQFPFQIEGFHSDNGSEYVNHKVAKMLEKLRIEQTKSRSRNSNDNALAESKNASVVRKHMGYSHIPQKYAKTPLECLVLLNKTGLVTFKSTTMLDSLLVKAKEKTDLQAAREMQKVKADLFAMYIKPGQKSSA